MAQKYLKYIKLINQSQFIMILPSYAMIKVHSVFRDEWPRREIAIQTELPLPRIRLSHQKNKLKGMGNDSHLAFCGSDGIKEGGLGCQIDASMRATSYVTIKGQNQVLREVKDRKENSYASLQTSKLEAKSFKFLTFEENLLKSAILKHLEGRALSRNERKKMDQIITISFVTKQTRKDRFRGMFQPEDFNIIEVPQHEEVSASIMDIVNGIRSAYAKLHLHTKEKDQLMGNTNRRILHTVQSIICKGPNQQIYEPSITSWDKENILSNYLLKYVKKTEFKESFSSSEDTKNRLMNFYQEIYNRYEATPFNQSVQEEEAPLPKENLLLAKPLKARVSKQPFCTTDESFIKLRFYNNLRKEVKTLGQDAQKIISQQMNKFNKF